MKAPTALIAMVAVAALPCALGYPSYNNKIPNGEKVKDGNGEAWPGVGHLNRK